MSDSPYDFIPHIQQEREISAGLGCALRALMNGASDAIGELECAGAWDCPTQREGKSRPEIIEALARDMAKAAFGILLADKGVSIAREDFAVELNALKGDPS